MGREVMGGCEGIRRVESSTENARGDGGCGGSGGGGGCGGGSTQHKHPLSVLKSDTTNELC